MAERDIITIRKSSIYKAIIFVLIITIVASLIYFNKRNNYISGNDNEAGNDVNEVSSSSKTIKYSNRFRRVNESLVNDTKTNHYWLIAPDKSYSYEEAAYYSELQSNKKDFWQIPSSSEILQLYNPNKKAGIGFYLKGSYYPAKIDPAFNAIGSGAWFWVNDIHSDPNKAYAINLHKGIKVEIDLYDTNIPVHVLLIKK